MAIKLIIDSAADLSPTDLDDSVTILPCPVHIDGKIYLPYVDLSARAFYRLQQEACRMPRTEPVSKDTIRQAFKSTLKAGDDIIGIFMASKMSPTFRHAEDVKKELKTDRIYLIDAQTVSFPYAALVMEAHRLIKEGQMKADEVAQRVEYLVPRSKMLAVIDDVTYLKLGGHSRGPIAVIADFLNFKPIISVEDGLIKTVFKERGRIKVFSRLVATVLKSNIDPELPIYIGHADNEEGTQALTEYLERKTHLKPRRIIEIGPTVGTHAGPRSIGLSFFVK